MAELPERVHRLVRTLACLSSPSPPLGWVMIVQPRRTSSTPSLPNLCSGMRSLSNLTSWAQAVPTGKFPARVARDDELHLKALPVT